MTTNSSIEAQVAAAEDTLLRAVLTSDADLLASVLHDDLLFNGPTGETATKAQDVANYRSGGIVMRRVESRDRRMSVIGDTVVVAVTVDLAGSYMGIEIDGSFQYLRVWKSVNERWQVIGGSVVAAPA